MSDVRWLRLFVPGGLHIPDNLCSVGFEVRIGALLDVFRSSIRVLDDGFILHQNVTLGEVVDAAWMEVAEWRDDKIWWNCRWALRSSGSLSSGQTGNNHGESDGLDKSCHRRFLAKLS